MPDLLLKHRPISLDGVKYKLSYNDSFFDISLSPPAPSHIHNCTELYLNISGDVSFLVKNSIYPIEHGDIILSNANDVHHCIYHSSCTHEHFCLWISSDENDELISFIEQSNQQHIVFPAEEKENLISLFFQLYSSLNAGDTLFSSSYLLQILAMLKLQLSQTTSAHRETLPADFQKILDYINENFATITNICELTDIFFISIATLNRRFSKHLSFSPKAYLEAVKLSNAMRMLDNGKSVTQTYIDCGYSDCSHFIRNFKKKFGITPYKYKNHHQIQQSKN